MMKFCESVAYIAYQLKFNKQLSREEIITSKLDELAYDLLRNTSRDILTEIWYLEMPLSIKHQNQIFVSEWSNPYTYELQSNGLYLDQLFSLDPNPTPDASLICTGCGNLVNSSDEICKGFWNQEDQEWPCVPGLVQSSECMGVRYQGKRVYCYFDLKENKPDPHPCQNCKEYFEWIERKLKNCEN